jgi:soluble lytic murein transglycosylase
MASMVLRTTASRLALGALLLTPAMCIAQQSGGDNPFATNQTISGDPVMEWQALRTAQRPSFDRVAGFLMAHPGWPNEAELKRAAEAALDINGYVPPHAADYFARFAPTNAAGHLRHALALLSANRADDARAAARRAWTTGSLNADEEARLLALFPAGLTQADHDDRMDRLLWSNATTAAARQIALVSPARSPEFSARLAMRTRATAAALRAAEAEALDPSLVRSNAGYIADKAGWLAATGQNQAAYALLSGPRALAAPPRDTEKWLELLLAQARTAVNAGSTTSAYNIARQVDDLLPTGSAILEQPIGVRDDYTSLVWLAADTAHHKLQRPREAVGLYALYASGGRSPQVQARGLYWAGRAATDANDRTLAETYYARAARNFDQFHGQLALERLGEAQPRPPAPAATSFSAAERDAFNNNSLVRAARSLGTMGAWRDQSLFLRTIANNARTDADHYFAAQLSAEIGRPDLGVMIGRSARINGYDDYAPVSFPTIAVPPGYEDNWTFIHAISRQESQFDQHALSHAGARGLMQLIPGTAREQAGLLGLGYDGAQLFNDPAYNIMLGSAYFKRMLSYYGGSYPLAVAAYNAGPGNVNRWLRSNGDPRTGAVDILDWIEAIPLSETRGYVQRVLENAVVYETIRPGVSEAPRNRLSYYLGKRNPG